MNVFKCVLWHCVAFATLRPIICAVPEVEYAALQSLYDSSGGENWVWFNSSRQWDFSGASDPCIDRWEGVFCPSDCAFNQSACCVTGLDLRLHNMSGTLPSQLSDLINIEMLDLSFNFIRGAIPNEIGDLHSMRLLDMSYLCLQGEIPPTLMGLSKLERLYLVHNHLSGPIPPLSGLSSLLDLDLSENAIRNSTRVDYNASRSFSIIETLSAGSGYVKYPTWALELFFNSTCGPGFSSIGLSGSVPESLAELSKLERCFLSMNSLSGEVPFISSLHMPNLTVLDLSINFLASTIPTEIATFSNLNLLSLSDNALTGTIPSVLFSNMPHLEVLDLSDNLLNGFLGVSVGSLSALKEFYLAFNNFTGTLPTQIGLLTNLEVLALGRGRNCFDGSLSSQLGNLLKLRELEISETALTGTIPASFRRLSSLKILNLADNNRRFIESDKCYRILKPIEFGLSGQIPTNIWSLTKLNALVLKGNRLSGDIPTLNIGNMVNLIQLNLERNGLGKKGFILYSVPSGISQLSNLKELYLSSNAYFSVLPSELGRMSCLELFGMDSNLLFGTVPDELASLSALSVLSLNNNQLGKLQPTGDDVLPIPQVVFEMTSLQALYLNSNGFVGQISSKIGALVNVEFMTLSSNKLSGTIPSALKFCRSLHTLTLANNNLTKRLPDELFDIPSLNVLTLSDNFFTGSFPPKLAVLSTLTDISIGYNCFHGQLPLVWNLPLLEGFTMSNNDFSGELPSGITTLSSLRFAEWDDNNFFGHLPQEVENLFFLTNFDISDNCFSGSLPNFKMNYMSFFSIDENRFSGLLPNSLIFGPLDEFSQMKLMRLSGNFFTGSPPQLQNFLSLEGCVIRGNMFTGPIVQSDFKTTASRRLFYLDFSDNMITGDVGAILRNFEELEIVSLFNNLLTGSIPSDTPLYLLQSMRINDNFITGSLPDWLGRIISLDVLLLQNNFIEGSDLRYFFHLDQKLAHVDLSNNFFSGSLPVSLWRLKTLQTVALSNNCFRYLLRLCTYICSFNFNFDHKRRISYRNV